LSWLDDYPDLSGRKVRAPQNKVPPNGRSRYLAVWKVQQKIYRLDSSG